MALYVFRAVTARILLLMPKTESTFADALSAALRAHVKAGNLVGLDCATELDAQQVKTLLGEHCVDVRPTVFEAGSSNSPRRSKRCATPPR